MHKSKRISKCINATVQMFGIAALFALTSPLAAGEGDAFVTLPGDNAITPLQNKLVWPAGKAPHNVDITPDSKRLCVANLGSQDVTVVDIARARIIKRIPLSPPHYGIYVTPDGKYALVTGIGGTVLNVIDTRKLKRIKQIEVGRGPHGARSDADSQYAYVAVSGANQLVKIDIETLQVSERIDIGSFPFWVAVNDNT